MVRRESKRLTAHERGVVGARARWGARRVLRLDTLPPAIRSAIEAMVAAEQNAREREAREAADS